MDIIKELETKIHEYLEYFKNQLAAIRGSRPTPKLIEDILVDYYGQKLTIKQLGAISVVLPREIHVSVWDKAAVSAVAKAIESSDIRVGANVDGNLIRINLPPLSEERRQELVKIVKKEAEESRIKIRASRDEINKKVEQQFKDKEITEDDKFKTKEKIQEAVEKTNRKIEELLEIKIKEMHE